MRNEKLIADSTFYLFFIDDIKETDSMFKILKEFEAQIPPKVYDEISKTGNKLIIPKINQCCNVFEKSDINFGELIRPLFSKDEIERGEHEVIAVAYMSYNLKLKILIIMDDQESVNFINTHFPHLSAHLKRTAGFIGDCCCIYKIFKTEQTVEILESMKKSKFRIDAKHVDAVIQRVKDV